MNKSRANFLLDGSSLRICHCLPVLKHDFLKLYDIMGAGKSEIMLYVHSISANLSCAFNLPEYPPYRAARVAVRLPYQAPVRGERSEEAHQAVLHLRSPAVGPTRIAGAARPEAAPAERSSPSGPPWGLAADGLPMLPVGSGAGSSGSTGR